MPGYAKIINNWKNLTAAPIEEKMKRWYFKGLNWTKTEVMESVQFINQWYFIGLNFEKEMLVWTGVLKPRTLKVAKGKFVSNSQCEEIFDS